MKRGQSEMTDALSLSKKSDPEKRRQKRKPCVFKKTRNRRKKREFCPTKSPPSGVYSSDFFTCDWIIVVDMWTKCDTRDRRSWLFFHDDVADLSYKWQRVPFFWMPMVSWVLSWVSHRIRNMLTCGLLPIVGLEEATGMRQWSFFFTLRFVVPVSSITAQQWGVVPLFWWQTSDMTRSCCPTKDSTRSGSIVWLRPSKNTTSQWRQTTRNEAVTMCCAWEWSGHNVGHACDQVGINKCLAKERLLTDMFISCSQCFFFVFLCSKCRPT